VKRSKKSDGWKWVLIVPWSRNTVEYKRYLISQREAEEKRIKEIQELSRSKQMSKETDVDIVIEKENLEEETEKQLLNFILEKSSKRGTEVNVPSKVYGKEIIRELIIIKDEQGNFVI
jgi:hypothetical protein